MRIGNDASCISESFIRLLSRSLDSLALTMAPGDPRHILSPALRVALMLDQLFVILLNTAAKKPYDH